MSVGTRGWASSACSEQRAVKARALFFEAGAPLQEALRGGGFEIRRCAALVTGASWWMGKGGESGCSEIITQLMKKLLKIISNIELFSLMPEINNL